MDNYYLHGCKRYVILLIIGSWIPYTTCETCLPDGDTTFSWDYDTIAHPAWSAKVWSYSNETIMSISLGGNLVIEPTRFDGRIGEDTYTNAGMFVNNIQKEDNETFSVLITTATSMVFQERVIITDDAQELINNKSTHAQVCDGNRCTLNYGICSACMPLPSISLYEVLGPDDLVSIANCTGVCSCSTDTMTAGSVLRVYVVVSGTAYIPDTYQDFIIGHPLVTTDKTTVKPADTTTTTAGGGDPPAGCDDSCQLALIITFSILGVVGCAVGGYFLYKYCKKRRTVV